MDSGRPAGRAGLNDVMIDATCVRACARSSAFADRKLADVTDDVDSTHIQKRRVTVQSDGSRNDVTSSSVTLDWPSP